MNVSACVSAFLTTGLLLIGLTGVDLQTPSDPAPSAMTAPAPKLVPFLWYDRDAEDAVRFYQRVFPGTKVLEQHRWGEGGPVPKGTLMTARIELCGQQLILLNGGPTFRLSEAVSLVVHCDDQAEIDGLWAKLTVDGGAPSQCGWLKDRFGLSWQIVPRQLTALLTDPDPARAKRATAAMMSMQKLDLAALQRAADGR